ncbi:hypothetical protein OROHE_014882 [Orobanche hederae]
MGDDVESALKKTDNNNNNNSPSCYPAPSASGSGLSTLSSSSRLVSLDTFHGFTVVLMIFVDDASGILPTINHSPWNGLTLADFVMPFFLFMVGVSFGLVHKTMPCGAAATRKAICRAVKLLVLGLFLQELMVFLLTSIYLLLLYAIYVPDWAYWIPYDASSEAKIYMVKCGVRGDTGPACNAAGMIDCMILGVNHLYRKPIYARTQQCSINSPDYGPLPPDAPSWCEAPFDPEGCLRFNFATL